MSGTSLRRPPERSSYGHGPLLIVSGFFPPRPGGGSEVLRNLLNWLDPTEYVVATGGLPPDEVKTTPVAGARVHLLSWASPVHWKGHQLTKMLQIPLAAIRAARLARRERCRAILGVYPDLQFMAVAYLAHRMTRLPLAAYLLDLFEEQGHGGYLGVLARWLQARVLRSARPLWTISQAMADHLRGTQSVPAEPLLHCYNEPIPEVPPVTGDFSKDGLALFFCGAVYDINAASLGRVVRVAGRLAGARVNVFGPNPRKLLERYDLLAPHVQTGFFSHRADLLAFMATQDVLLACLSWPDESWVGSKELSTIFSTKLPEYFAQGRPILVHCPDDYFLARFVREHDCAWVVSERSEDAIGRTIEQIWSDAGTRSRRCANALAAARLFAGDRVTLQFLRALDRSLS